MHPPATRTTSPLSFSSHGGLGGLAPLRLAALLTGKAERLVRGLLEHDASRMSLLSLRVHNVDTLTRWLKLATDRIEWRILRGQNTDR